ncbi:hypothetical protein [Paenibacillus sp.]|uniref:hypothetical protein n=1 Tax=Paenibacillus sp. TaxID=58172 RepID=UPI002D530F0D|nr:hypothetical protein [Paenibacillus sp.]HZG55238.1 hypothetical protein [Paenibacillus sp.]
MPLDLYVETPERVRRVHLGLQPLQRYAPEAKTSALGAPGLGVPAPARAAR